MITKWNQRKTLEHVANTLDYFKIKLFFPLPIGTGVTETFSGTSKLQVSPLLQFSHDLRFLHTA